jgi:hypothetical protein
LARGKIVHFVSRNATVGARLEGGSMGWEALGQPHLALMLANPGFSLHARSFIVDMEELVTIAAQDAPQRMQTLDADTLIMCSGNFPEHGLAASLREGGQFPFRLVGDAISGPRLLRQAVLTGHQAGRGIGRESGVLA